MDIRKGLRHFIRFVMRLATRTHAAGLENMPPTGGYILALNHLSRLDAPVIFAHLERPDVTALVAKKYQKNPFFRWLVESVKGTWIDRSTTDYQALRTAIKHLHAGGLLFIAPEGTRSPNQALIEAKPGVAYLATKAKVPIIPVAVRGTEKVLGEWKRLRLPEIHLEFGQAFLLPELDRKDREGSLQRNADEIMCRIAVLLPEAYHGVYNGHPRLVELLSMTSSQEKEPTALV